MFTQCCSASLPSLQMQQWFNIEGERHLLEAESVEDSGDRMEQILNSFTGFLIEANVSLTLLVSVIASVFAPLSESHSSAPQDRRHHAMSLVSEAERLQQSWLSYPETDTFRSLVCAFKSGLEDFLSRAEACGRELQIMVNVCDFCEQVCKTSWFSNLVHELSSIYQQDNNSFTITGHLSATSITFAEVIPLHHATEHKNIIETNTDDAVFLLKTQSSFPTRLWLWQMNAPITWIRVN